MPFFLKRCRKVPDEPVFDAAPIFLKVTLWGALLSQAHLTDEFFDTEVYSCGANAYFESELPVIETEGVAAGGWIRRARAPAVVPTAIAFVIGLPTFDLPVRCYRPAQNLAPKQREHEGNIGRRTYVQLNAGPEVRDSRHAHLNQVSVKQ